MHVWTDNRDVSLTQTQFLAHGDTANVSSLCCGVHTGTHVDAPRHFIDGAGGVETLDVDALCGSALVVDFRHLDDSIDAASLATLDLSGVSRVVFATRNSQLWATETFTFDFVSIAPSAAEVLVDQGIRLVGIDYLSVGSPETHRALLSAGVICLEGLDMTGIDEGLYDIYCGPVKLEGADGAPARVLLRHAQTMRHDPPDQEMTADPSAVSTTEAPA
jgi:arylformamidase